MRRERFAIDNFYHIYNRGVEKRTIFLDERDYRRFVLYLYFLNDKNFVINNFLRINGGGLTSPIGGEKPREPFVDIVSWCLMPNHFHLLVKERLEGGASKFMQRLGTAYTMYFNLRYKRSGGLFQGTFKSRHIDRDAYFMHISRYIHLNPLELRYPEWKEKGIKDARGALAFLEQYRWSSLLVYLRVKIRQRNFDKIIESKDLFPVFGNNSEEYRRFLLEWIRVGMSPEGVDNLGEV
jgi:putative transposase